MRVIVAGAGEIGWYIAEQVSAHGHDVTIIDNDETRIKEVESQLDVQAVYGTAASVAMLLQAGVEQADLVIAVTRHDETNIVCASLAKALGAGRTVARVDEVLYRKAPRISYREHFGIDELVSPEMLAALELASIVRNPGALAVEHFARGDLEMQQVVAGRGAQLVGKPLFELEMPASVRIASIKRGDKLIIPTRNDSIIHDDRVTIIGQTEQVMHVRAGLEAEARKVIKVVIMGGGHTTLSLARRLRSHSFRLTIIERDQRRCQFLASYMPSATILHGDGTNLVFLQEERIESADIFISTTSSDEANILSAIQARNMGVSKVLVVIHRPDYGNLAEKLGISKAISPRVVMANEMLALLQKGDVCSLAQLNDGEAEILQLTVRNVDFIGPCLRDLPLPEGALVLTGHRGRDLIMPSAETCFQAGDVVLVICHHQQRKKVIRMIVGNV